MKTTRKGKKYLVWDTKRGTLPPTGIFFDVKNMVEAINLTKILNKNIKSKSWGWTKIKKKP